MLQQRIASSDGQAKTLRPTQLLRQATAADHAVVEAGFAPFMTDPRAHLTRFLAAQLIANRALAAHRAGPGLAAETAVLDDLIARLERDLGPAGATLPAPASGAAISADAVAYLVLGSRLGTELIKRHLAAHLIALPHAFRAAPSGTTWRAFGARIDAYDPGGRALNTLIRDARRGFSFFREAARLAGLSEIGRTP